MDYGTRRRFIHSLAQTYARKRISRSAASLSYFLTLSVFPMLICVYVLMGKYFPDTGVMLDFLRDFLPDETLDAIRDYLVYIGTRNHQSMLAAGLIGMATTSAATFRAVHNIMADLRGKPRYTGLLSLLISFLFSFVFLAAVYFAAIVMITGNWFITMLNSHLSYLDISESWNWVRFLLLFGILLAIIYGLYKLTAPIGEEAVVIFPGALTAAVAMVGVSIIFSMFIGLSVRYPLIYGSLASVIILMLWFYFSALVVIMGNAINVLLERRRGFK